MINLTQKITATIATAAVILAFVPAAFATNDGDSHHHKSGNKFFSFMTGEQEVPGPGDSDGRGFAKVKIDKEAGKLCVHIHAKNIDPATAAHIHIGEKGVAGPVVVALPTPDAHGRSHGCVDVPMDTLKEIKENPSEYYINIHNEAYPNGAIRGQLH